MPKTVLFIVTPDQLFGLQPFQYYFKVNHFKILEATSWADAEKIFSAQGAAIDLIVIHGFKTEFSEPLNKYKGKLPPIIYRYPTRDPDEPHISRGKRNNRRILRLTHTEFPSKLFAYAKEVLKMR